MASEQASKPKPYTSRVSEEVVEAIGLVSNGIKLVSDATDESDRPGSDRRDRSGSDRRVVYRGLQLVLKYAEKDQPKLIRDYNTRLRAQIDSGASLSSPSTGPSLAEQLRAEAAQYEVPTGSRNIQCDVDAEMDSQLQLVGQWTGRDKSELVRHGLFLVFDETRRKATAFEKKLAEDHDAGKKILAAITRDPSFGNAAANSTSQRPSESPAKQPAKTPAAAHAGKTPAAAPAGKTQSKRASSTTTKTGVSTKTRG